MSFLLLKSKSRSSRPTSYRSKQQYQQQQQSKQHSNGYPNSNNNDRNPSIAMRSQPTSTSRRFSYMKEVHAGDGQVQLQRPMQQQHQQQHQGQSHLGTLQRKQANQQQQQSVHQTNQKQNDIISMDEVMEDLRILEQQQRDSQRLLASIKLTKQYKLEQRVSLETKLSELKYSNGEARAQLQRARDVLSKSTRELGSAKLQSERSSDNLKKFDDKLRKVLNHVRGLHTKRRQVEQAMCKLRNANAVLSQRERTVLEQIKCKGMERDDAKHREKLLIKSIQSSKRKVQEYVENTMKMRSDLSELESDLTVAQQMEASTKFRVDTLSNEAQAEQKRHENAKDIILARINEVHTAKIDIERKIIDKSKETDAKIKTLTEAFQRCISMQKEDGFELSTSPKTAAIDVDRLRSLVEGEESNLRVVQEEECTLIQRTQTIQEQIKELQTAIEQMDNEASKINDDIIQMREVEQVRKIKNESFMAEFKKEQEELNELQQSIIRLKKEQDSNNQQSRQHETDQKALVEEARTNIHKIDNEILNLDEAYKAKKTELENQLKTNKDVLDEVQKGVTAQRIEFDSVQKLADDLKATSFDVVEEIAIIEAKGRDELKSLQEERAKLCDTYPCLSSLEITFDPRKDRKEQVENALVDLSNACTLRLDTAKREKEQTLQEESEKVEREAEERARVEEEERIRYEKQVRLEAEEEERKKLELEAEAEERLRAETLAKLKAKKKAEEIRKRLEFESELEAEAEQRLNAEKLAKAKAKKKAIAEEARREKRLAEAKESSRNNKLMEQKVLRKAKEDHRRRNRKLIEEKMKKKDELNDSANRHICDSKLKEPKSRLNDKAPLKTKNNLSNDLKMFNNESSPIARKSGVSPKRSRSKIAGSDEKRRRKSEIVEVSKRGSTSAVPSDTNMKSSSKSKHVSSVSEEVKKSRNYKEKQMQITSPMKRVRSHSIDDTDRNDTVKRSSKITKRRKQSTIQKLNIFSQSEPIEFKSRRPTTSNTSSTKGKASGSKSSSSRKESSSRRSSSQSTKPSHSQATVSSRKSSSTTRRRKNVGSAILGKPKTSQSTSADLDFTFM